MLRTVCGSVNLAVQGGGVEFRDGDIALVQRIEAVLIVIAAGLAVRAELPQRLPAVNGNAAGRGVGIGKGIQHGRVDVGVGGAADLVLAVPGIAAVNHVGPVIKVQLFALGAQLVGAVQHQDVLDDNAVGLAVILEFADLVRPGRSPVDDLQVLVLAVDQLAPAGLVQTENQVAVLVLVGGLDSGGITRDDAVVVDADGEAGFLGLLNQPGGTLGGVGVGVNPDGVSGIVRIVVRRGCHAERQDHAQRQRQSKNLLHVVSSCSKYFCRSAAP